MIKVLLFHDSSLQCAVFSNDADHVHASVELGHVDMVFITIDFSIVNNLTED